MGMTLRGVLGAGALVAAILAPVAGRAEPVVTNPFGNLQMKVLREPSGVDSGLARLTIVTANGAAFSGGSTIYFGLRVMGSEDMEMTSFRLPRNKGRCIVSDFAGRNTKGGWQLGPAFGAQGPYLGSPNSHMRMIGGYLKKSCGNVEITVSFRERPLVAFYGAFFGYSAAPWHANYKQSPWDSIPTGGNATYENWWNLWGQFDTLGYSNACTNVSGPAVSCG